MASLRKRRGIFYIQFYVGPHQRRQSLETDNLQIAKERVRQYESAQVRGENSPFPTRTPIPEVLTAYAAYIRGRKTAKSAQTDIYYLRSAFGPACEALKINSRRRTFKKRPPRPDALPQDLRMRPVVIEAQTFEQISTVQITAFLSGQVQSRGLAPKTANRYREILCRLFNWAMDEFGLRLPGSRNPAAKVKRYRERAPVIRFLTLKQIDEQLDALKYKPQVQTMVALYIYAGLRREEALWLTQDDIDLASGSHGMIRVRAKTVDEEFWEPKTKVNRAVPISSTLRGYLDRYTSRPSKGNWFFPSPWATRWDPDNFSQDLRAANKEAGLPWGCLDFRHTFGSQLAMKGESLYKIATLMGNSPVICQRHYAAILPESLTDTVEFVAPAPKLRLVDAAG